MTDKWFRSSPLAVAVGLVAAIAWTTPALAQTETAPAATASDLPDAKKVIAAAIDAMGGKKAFEDVESSHIKGNMTTPMGEMSLEMFSAKPNKFLFIQSMPAMGMEITAGCDGDVGWMISPMVGGAQILEGEQLDEMREQSQMYEMVLRMEEDFEEVKTVGREKFAEHDCYKLQMKTEDGEESDAFFDVESKLPVGIKTTTQEAGQPMDVSVVFSDWKQFGDIKGFTKMTITQMGMDMVMTFEEVEFNEVDPAKFALPDEVKAMATSQPATAPGG